MKSKLKMFFLGFALIGGGLLGSVGFSNTASALDIAASKKRVKLITKPCSYCSDSNPFVCTC